MSVIAAVLLFWAAAFAIALAGSRHARGLPRWVVLMALFLGPLCLLVAFALLLS